MQTYEKPFKKMLGKVPPMTLIGVTGMIQDRHCEDDKGLP